MTMNQLMSLVSIESASTVVEKGRKSRWEKAKGRKEGTRWGHFDDRPYLPPPYVDLPPGLSPAQMDQFLREQRFDELSRKLAMAELELEEPDIRSPSPPPIYDKNGNRTNTRDVRARNSMVAEHQRLVEYMIEHVDGFAPPTDYKPQKRIRKIEIPLDKYPEYNFMGLIIGPRGCNQKKLNAESGAHISLRGKGTQKEGKKTDHQTDEEAILPMHVHIVADTDEIMEKAVSLIEPLLDPCHPMHEEFKKRGLEQLALVNGVNFGQLDHQRCAVCGAIGHFAHECPDSQQAQNFKKPEIRCEICGDMGHVTMDCKLAKSYPPNFPYKFTSFQPAGNVLAQPNNDIKIDSEYKRMMNALTGESIKVTGESSNTSMPSPNIPGAMAAPMGIPLANIMGTPPPGLSPIFPNAVMGPYGPAFALSPIPYAPVSTDSSNVNDSSTQGSTNLPRGNRAGIGHPDRGPGNQNMVPVPVRGMVPFPNHGAMQINPQGQIYPNPLFVNPMDGPLPGQIPLQVPSPLANQFNGGQTFGPIPGQFVSPFPGQFPFNVPGHSPGQFPNQIPNPVNGVLPGFQPWFFGIPRPAAPINMNGQIFYPPPMMMPISNPNTIDPNQVHQVPIQLPTINQTNSQDIPQTNQSTEQPPSNNNESINIESINNESNNNETGNFSSPTNDAMDLSN